MNHKFDQYGRCAVCGGRPLVTIGGISGYGSQFEAQLASRPCAGNRDAINKRNEEVALASYSTGDYFWDDL